MKKILTKLDTNLISFSSEEVTNESLVKNELLIKELVDTIRNDNRYIARDQIQKLTKYEQLEAETKQLLAATNRSSLQQVSTLILDLVSKLNSRDKKIKELEQKLLAANSENEVLESQLNQLEISLHQAETKCEKLERQYNGQKDRKVVKFVDKLAKK